MSLENFKRDLHKKLVEDGIRLEIEQEDTNMNLTYLDEGVQFEIKSYGYPGVSASTYINLSKNEIKQILEFLLFKIKN